MLAQQLASSPFAALQSLHIYLDDGAVGVDLSPLVQALAQGCTPALEELTIQRWANGSVAPLGHAIQQGVLSRLSSLTLGFCHPSHEDFAALVDGLRAPHMRMRELSLAFNCNSQQDVACLAAAVRAGGGLGHLQRLTLTGFHGGPQETTWDPVMVALASPAPCSQTLTKLELDRSDLTDVGVLSLFGGLGSGCFPSLESLTLWGVDDNDAHALSHALLALAQNDASSGLKCLALGRACVSLGWLEELSSVFAAGALPPPHPPRPFH